jgi:hypothetical protein
VESSIHRALENRPERLLIRSPILINSSHIRVPRELGCRTILVRNPPDWALRKPRIKRNILFNPQRHVFCPEGKEYLICAKSSPY